MSLLGLLVMGVAAAYGSQTNQPQMNGKLKVTTLSPEEICYTGKPYSKELGAYVFNHRNYDPQTSRWTTPDPSGFPDGANNRLYVNNASTHCYDSSGFDMAAITETISIGSIPAITWTGDFIWTFVHGQEAASINPLDPSTGWNGPNGFTVGVTSSYIVASYQQRSSMEQATTANGTAVKRFVVDMEVDFNFVQYVSGIQITNEFGDAVHEFKKGAWYE